MFPSLSQTTQIAAKLKEHKKLKSTFAKTLSVSEKVIQQCAEELIIIGKANGGVITLTNILKYAENENSNLHPLFNWEDTSASREIIAGALIDNITILIGSDNKIYTLQTE